MSSSDFRKPKIKPVSRETDFAKLKSFDSFQEVDRRLRLGWAFADVARYMQEQGDYTDVPHQYLTNLLSKYFASIPPLEKTIGASSALGKKLAKQVDEGLNEVEELQRLYEMQMQRIEIDFTHEKNMNKLLPTTGKEIYVAMKLLNQSAQVKMDLGLVKRQIGAIEVNGQVAAQIGEHYGKESVGKVLADPESRRRVLGMAEKLFMLAEKAGLDTVQVTKGIEEQENQIIDAQSEEAKSEDENGGGDSAEE